MRVDAFDFELPEELIALRPVEPREAARLLVVGSTGGEDGGLADKHFSDLPSLLRPGDVLVFNDTRVIHARLSGIRRREVAGQEPAEARIEVTLTEPEADREGAPVWRGFARPAKRLKEGERIAFGDDFAATVLAKDDGGAVTLSFETGGRDFAEALDAHGTMPLPPYIAARRAPDAKDDDDYQTVFAAHDGSVAAPTAGLHFSDALLEALAGAGIARAMVTLHVGPGTFLPVKAADTTGHHMHAEWGSISTACARQLNRARAEGGRIVAVGTTALRLLESAADDAGLIHPFEGETDIFITPGYRFKATDLMITNFHLPRSTLFMLVSAFSGLETMKQAYAHAIAARYRFYSYGDGCLLHPAESGS